MQVDLSQAITLLQRGEVVAIPTETVYGLAADANNDQALSKIYALKKRPANNPLIVHIAEVGQVLDWAEIFSPLAQRLAAVFWPGPFTLVLPAKAHVSNILRANQPTVALRVPNHASTLIILQQSGLALAAPSANTHTQVSPTTAAHVTASLGEHVSVFDGGACKVGIESTIVSVEDDNWHLLRLGMISEAEIEAIADQPAFKGNDSLPVAPGQQKLHYSPNTPIQLFASRFALQAYAEKQEGCAALIIGQGDIANAQTFCLSNNPDEAAERLYSTLHQIDALHKNKLLVETPPKAADWSAIHDRLERAAHKNT